MYEFYYNNNNSYESNFRTWKILNDKERREYKEKIYSEDEARTVFDSLYKNKFIPTSCFLANFFPTCFL